HAHIWVEHSAELPPPCGGGLGWGVWPKIVESRALDLTPTPGPPPSRGRRNSDVHTVSPGNTTFAPAIVARRIKAHGSNAFRRRVHAIAPQGGRGTFAASGVARTRQPAEKAPASRLQQAQLVARLRRRAEEVRAQGQIAPLQPEAPGGEAEARRQQ